MNKHSGSHYGSARASYARAIARLSAVVTGTRGYQVQHVRASVKGARKFNEDAHGHAIMCQGNHLVEATWVCDGHGGKDLAWHFSEKFKEHLEKLCGNFGKLKPGDCVLLDRKCVTLEFPKVLSRDPGGGVALVFVQKGTGNGVAMFLGESDTGNDNDIPHPEEEEDIEKELKGVTSAKKEELLLQKKRLLEEFKEKMNNIIETIKEKMKTFIGMTKATNTNSWESWESWDAYLYGFPASFRTIAVLDAIDKEYNKQREEKRKMGLAWHKRVYEYMAGPRVDDTHHPNVHPMFPPEAGRNEKTVIFNTQTCNWSEEDAADKDTKVSLPIPDEVMKLTLRNAYYNAVADVDKEERETCRFYNQGTTVSVALLDVRTMRVFTLQLGDSVVAAVDVTSEGFGIKKRETICHGFDNQIYENEYNDALGRVHDADGEFFLKCSNRDDAFPAEERYSAAIYYRRRDHSHDDCVFIMNLVEPARTLEARSCYNDLFRKNPNAGDALIWLQRTPDIDVWQLDSDEWKSFAIFVGCDGFVSKLALPTNERMVHMITNWSEYTKYKKSLVQNTCLSTMLKCDYGYDNDRPWMTEGKLKLCIDIINGMINDRENYKINLRDRLKSMLLLGTKRNDLLFHACAGLMSKLAETRDVRWIDAVCESYHNVCCLTEKYQNDQEMPSFCDDPDLAVQIAIRTAVLLASDDNVSLAALIITPHSNKANIQVQISSETGKELAKKANLALDGVQFEIKVWIDLETGKNLANKVKDKMGLPGHAKVELFLGGEPIKPNVQLATQSIVDGTELKAIVSINKALHDDNDENGGISIKEAIKRWMDPARRQDVVDEYGDIDEWNTSQVTDMSRLFSRRKDFNEDISRWDTGKVENMEAMFDSALSFNQPLEAWDVSSVTNMREMFYWAHTFNQPLEAWDVSSVTNMQQMFENAIKFNQPLEAWDVRSVTNMWKMFAFAWSFNQPLEAWDVDTRVTNTDIMFVIANSLKHRPTWHTPINLDGTELLAITGSSVH